MSTQTLHPAPFHPSSPSTLLPCSHFSTPSHSPSFSSYPPSFLGAHTSTSAFVYIMCTKHRFRAEPSGACAIRRSRYRTPASSCCVTSRVYTVRIDTQGGFMHGSRGSPGSLAPPPELHHQGPNPAPTMSPGPSNPAHLVPDLPPLPLVPRAHPAPRATSPRPP